MPVNGMTESKLSKINVKRLKHQLFYQISCQQKYNIARKKIILVNILKVVIIFTFTIII